MGILMSMVPLLSIIVIPIWGLIADYFQRPRTILAFTAIVSALILVWVSDVSQFSMLLCLFIGFSLFQSAIGPIFDNLVVNYTRKIGKSYGSYRMWGAVSFALAAWFMGKIGEQYLYSLFYLFAGTLIIVSLLCIQLPTVSLPVRHRSHLR